MRYIELVWVSGDEKEFENYQSFKTHNLEVLLKLSGRVHIILLGNLADWSIVCGWSPESRYDAIGEVLEADALAFLESANTLLNLI